jgi:DNA polymerase-3 subunit delta
MSFNSILNSLKKKEYAPIYFLDGEETYFIDALTNYIAHHVLDESERDFNQSVLYAQDISPEDLVPVVKRFPMMAPYQVVIVKEAQNWRSMDALSSIFENPVNTTILVINYKGKKLDGRSKLLKAIKKTGVYFNSQKLRDYEIPKWIQEHCSARDQAIDPMATNLLAEYIGNDLGKLVNALEKLEILSEPGEKITPSMVSEHIGINKDFNVFELQRAIGQRNDAKALYIANYFANNQKDHHIIPVTASLFRYFTKLIGYHGIKNPTDQKSVASQLGIHPYFVKEYQSAARNYSATSLMNAIDIIYDIDLKSKGVNNNSANSGELLKEMVARLLRA